MSLVSVADVQDRGLGGGLDEDAIQDMIDAAEAWLARHIGPLTGERTEVFYPRRGYEPLYLRRIPSITYDSDLTVENNGTTLTLGESIGDYRLLYDSSVVELISSSWLPASSGFGIGPVRVTYTPDDEALIREAVIRLLRLDFADSPYVSERIGDYSYQKPQSVTSFHTARMDIVKGILPKRPFRSERLVASTNP